MDVFSFAVLMWEMLHQKFAVRRFILHTVYSAMSIPKGDNGALTVHTFSVSLQFYHYNRQDYKELVVEKNFRPSIDSSLSSRMKHLIKEAWDPDPKKRPTFDRLSKVLRAEYQEQATQADGALSRSESLLMLSVRSSRANLESKK